MDEMPNVETIYRQERRRWLKEEAPRKAVRDYLMESVPYWVVLIALVLYSLSAPHTAKVFNMLTPGWGWTAPVGVEFGLLYTAFRRRLAKVENQVLPWTLWALEILLFLTAMLVNGAGSFASVIEVTHLERLSFSGIVDAFSHLPATTQAALIMAVLSAFIIPIGVLVAGEGLASLALERRHGQNYREQRWLEVEFTVIYRAVFVRYLQSGLSDKEARHRAHAEVRGYLTQLRPPDVQLLSASSEQGGQNGQRANGRGESVKGRVKAYLDANPDLEQMSINQVLATLHIAGIEAGRTSVAEVLQERKHTS